MTLAPAPPSMVAAYTDLRRRVDSLERAPATVAGPHRVCITGAGETTGFSSAHTTPWRPWTAVTFTDLWAETTVAPGGGSTLELGLYVNGGQVGSTVLVVDGDTQGFTRFTDPVTVDVHDRVWFQVVADDAGPGVWRGVTVQAIGVSDHPVSAGLVFIDAGGEM